jgi:hypothetical protein
MLVRGRLTIETSNRDFGGQLLLTFSQARGRLTFASVRTSSARAASFLRKQDMIN